MRAKSQLSVDEMDWVGLVTYLSIAGLAASSDVGTASLLNGDGDYEIDC